MFVRTERLLLRPGWADDAPALHTAIAHDVVAPMLARLPWPYSRHDAEAFLARAPNPCAPHCLTFLRTAGEPRLIGGIGLETSGDAAELGFWISPAYWGLGFASEAGRAFMVSAQKTLQIPQIVARHFIDNPAAGHVLRKIGFERTGKVAPLFCLGRQTEVLAVEFAAAGRGLGAPEGSDMRHAPLLAA